MIVLDDRVGVGFEISYLEKIALSISDKDLELLFVDDNQMLQINCEQRAKNRSTDVLSFPLLDMPNSPLGSIVINIDKAKEKSLKLNHTLQDEVALLFIHGLLHILGYDHEEDNGEMREKEEELIKKFNLPKSLIVRSI